MAINTSQNALPGTELSTAMPGTLELVGSLPVSPAIIIFDNQSDDAVSLYINGTAAANLWHTFPTGEAIVLDLRAAHGAAPNFTFAQGTPFFATGAGTGNFSISYVYAQNT